MTQEPKTVLIVKDSVHLMVYEEYLASAGISVIGVRSATEAAACLGKRGDKIGLVLLDRNLEGDEKGEEVLSFIAKMARKPFVVSIAEDNFYQDGIDLYIGAEGLSKAMIQMPAADFIGKLEDAHTCRRGMHRPVPSMTCGVPPNSACRF